MGEGGPAAFRAWAVYAVLALLGGVLGLVGGFLHNMFVLVDLPIAAVFWVAALAALVHGAGRLMGGKAAPLVMTVAWMLVSLVLSGQRAEGDLIIASNADGYIYLYGGFVAMIISALMAPSRGGQSWLLSTHDFGRKTVA